MDARYIQNIRLFRTRVWQLLFNPFHATGLFLYFLKTSENLWFSNAFRGYRNRPLAWNGLMYQLFFRTPNLLLLLYPWLLIKSMTYAFAIRFFSQSLVLRYRALNNAPHRRYLTEFWNFGYGLRVNRRKIICILWNIITLLRNEIPGNNNLFKAKIKYGYQYNKKRLNFKN